jgi:hypothetical protein
MGYPTPWYSVEPSSDALVGGRWFGMIVCYLRDGERVFETYWALTGPRRQWGLCTACST